MQCLDDKETQMEEDTIFVRFGQTGLQVGNNRTVIMFYSNYQHTRGPLRPNFHSSSFYYAQPCPPTTNTKSNNSKLKHI